MDVRAGEPQTALSFIGPSGNFSESDSGLACAVTRQTQFPRSRSSGRFNPGAQFDFDSSEEPGERMANNMYNAQQFITPLAIRELSCGPPLKYYLDILNSNLDGRKTASSKAMQWLVNK